MNLGLSRFTPAGMLPSNDEVMLRVSELDQQGLHQQSLQVLYEAGRRKHIPAVTALGKRLFYGLNTPQEMQQGFKVLQAAAKEGDAEAMTVMAVVQALGIFVPQSWQKAVEYLVIAAQKGWLPAQGQLISLTQDDSLADDALQGNMNHYKWKKLAKAVDLEFWKKPAQKKPLSESPEIVTMPGFVPPRLCVWMIELARHGLSRAQVYDSVNRKETVSYTRTNRSTEFSLMTTDVATLLMQARIGATTEVPVSHMEPVSVLHYAIGEEIKPHYDFITSTDARILEQVKHWGQRRITFIIYLNDDYEGGKTTFPKLGLVNRGKRGDAIYFVNIRQGSDPDMLTQHTGSPPTSGEKWIVTQFIREQELINIKI